MNDEFVKGVINTTNDNFLFKLQLLFCIKIKKNYQCLNQESLTFLGIASPIIIFNSMGCIYNKNMTFVIL